MPNVLAAAVMTVICAASSLRNVLEEITVGLNVRLTTAASNALARQITEGAPCDLFFSADSESMNRIKPLAAKELLSNRLVMIIPKGSQLKPTKIEDLTSAAYTRIALPDKAVPIGHYARAYLDHRDLLTKLLSRIVQPTDVRATLAWVENGNADVGFVYKTDALQSARVEIALEIKNLEEKIVYPLGTLNDKPETKNIFGKLSDNRAKAIYQKFGFIVIEN